mgnify:CR=1 FL=1
MNTSKRGVIGPYAFAESGIRHFSAPVKLQKIYNNAFDSCVNLSVVDLSEVNLSNFDGNNKLTIQAGAFNGCNKLNTLALPTYFEFDGSGAFANCPAI